MSKLKLFLNECLPTPLLKCSKTVFHSIRNILMKGDAVKCPCCNMEFTHFLDWKLFQLHYSKLPAFKESNYDSTYKNITCPNCHSLPRHRIICYYFETIREQIITYSPNILVFSVDAITTWLKQNRCDYIIADLIDTKADLQLDIQDTKQPDNSWSLIICNHILEHVENYKLALKELHRILKDDGILEISIPTDYSIDETKEGNINMSESEKIELFGQSDHLRVFGKDIYNTLTESGFNVEIIDGNTLPANIRSVVGPATYDDNKVYICKKK